MQGTSNKRQNHHFLETFVFRASKLRKCLETRKGRQKERDLPDFREMRKEDGDAVQAVQQLQRKADRDREDESILQAMFAVEMVSPQSLIIASP